jgi:hypothetical protein
VRDRLGKLQSWASHWVPEEPDHQAQIMGPGGGGRWWCMMAPTHVCATGSVRLTVIVLSPGGRPINSEVYLLHVISIHNHLLGISTRR